MLPNECEKMSDEWWVMSDGNWVMEIEWWKMVGQTGSYYFFLTVTLIAANKIATNPLPTNNAITQEHTEMGLYCWIKFDNIKSVYIED